jgi:hypothetical protein
MLGIALLQFMLWSIGEALLIGLLHFTLCVRLSCVKWAPWAMQLHWTSQQPIL